MHKPCVDTVDVDFRRKGLFFFFLVVRNVVVIVLRGFFSVLADFEGQGHKRATTYLTFVSCYVTFLWVYW